MNEFLDKEVIVKVSTQSGAGLTGEGVYAGTINNTITIKGMLSNIEADFIIIKNAIVNEIPIIKQIIAKGFKVPELIPSQEEYSKILINKDKIITIAMV